MKRARPRSCGAAPDGSAVYKSFSASAEPEALNARAMYEHEAVIPAMEAARQVADELEGRVGKEYWPMPSYADLLFYV